MRFLSVLTSILLAACASAPPPALLIGINGQVIDRQFRELVVTVSNGGSTVLHDVAVEVTLPPDLAIIKESHDEAMRLRTQKNGGFSYSIETLAPGTQTVARYPFRRQSAFALAGREVKVVAGGVEMRRTISE
jgi:hypothetical protein